jgi:transposase
MAACGIARIQAGMSRQHGAVCLALICSHCRRFRRVPPAGAGARAAPGGLGDTLIVEALGDKYIDHQPIERQSRRYNRAGADVAPQTLGRSVAAAIDLLSPIAREIRKQTRASALLATDATGLPVLDEDPRMASAMARCGAGLVTTSG